MMRRSILAIAIASALVGAPAAAEDDENRGLGETLDSTVLETLRTLERFIEAFPGYEAPEITPEGDIIIRKKRPAPKKADPPATDQRQT